ncbi:hypothetical protein FGIG_05180 [Fasciola gigantica]|uniref:Uncharacterized protein n=1 Tax=Fasciola gigantica TaxID=46835 RepID=A0A504YMM2_FASGI|nr:hypothetical protein FGIG_05180 [Fasciola gigantica]
MHVIFHIVILIIELVAHPIVSQMHLYGPFSIFTAILLAMVLMSGESFGRTAEHFNAVQNRSCWAVQISANFESISGPWLANQTQLAWIIDVRDVFSSDTVLWRKNPTVFLLKLACELASYTAFQLMRSEVFRFLIYSNNETVNSSIAILFFLLQFRHSRRSTGLLCELQDIP